MNVDEFASQSRPGRSVLSIHKDEIRTLLSKGFLQVQVLEFLRLNQVTCTKQYLSQYIKKFNLDVEATESFMNAPTKKANSKFLKKM